MHARSSITALGAGDPLFPKVLTCSPAEQFEWPSLSDAHESAHTITARKGVKSEKYLGNFLFKSTSYLTDINIKIITIIIIIIIIIIIFNTYIALFL